MESREEEEDHSVAVAAPPVGGPVDDVGGGDVREHPSSVIDIEGEYQGDKRDKMTPPGSYRVVEGTEVEGERGGNGECGSNGTLDLPPVTTDGDEGDKKSKGGSSSFVKDSIDGLDGGGKGEDGCGRDEKREGGEEEGEYDEEDPRIFGRWSHTNVLRRLANHRIKALTVPEQSRSGVWKKNTVLHNLMDDFNGVKDIMSSLKKKKTLKEEKKNPAKIVQALHKRGIVINDLAVILSIVAVIFMILAHERSVSNNGDQDELVELYRWVMFISSALVECCIFGFYSTMAHIRRLDNPLFHGHSGWTIDFYVVMFMEMLINAIMPYPLVHHTFTWTETDIATSTDSDVQADLDVLGLFMFLRLYLLVRFLNLHATMNTTSTSRFLAKLNYIEFDSWVTIKVHLHYNPMKFIAGTLVVYIFIASYSMRICEGYGDSPLSSFAHDVWVVIITMLSVGYGDMVPGSDCGRAVAVVSGTFGMVISALVVAVLTNGIKLNHIEETILDFIHKEEARKEYVSDASDVIVHAYRTHLLRKRGPRWKYVMYNYFLVLKLAKFRKDRRAITRDIQNARIIRPYYDFFLDQLEFRKNDQEENEEVRANMNKRIDVLEKKIEDLPAKIAALLKEGNGAPNGKEKVD
eukprot:Nk52_evm51s2391 gene=Nk52_evmTU51s2391